MRDDDISRCAGAIREHLWRPTAPTFHGEKRPWTMARELSIARILLAAGFRGDDLVGAIAQVRRLKPDWTGPLSLRVFYWKRQDGYCATPFLEECIGEWHKRRDREAREAKYVRLPPTVSAVLRQLVG